MKEEEAKSYDHGKLGIAKRDIKGGEEFCIEIGLDGTLLPNDTINFIEGRNICDLQ